MTILRILLGLTGCSDYGQTALTAVDQFDVSDRSAVDVLLVVDNSSSMAPYQAQMGANFSAFIEPFMDGNIDYQIAITTTDDGNDATVADAAAGSLVAPIITADMTLAEAEAIFSAGVMVGTEGSGFETGLKTALLALTDPDRVAERHPTFPREEAALSVIFVSDEEDQSPGPVSEYLDAFWAIKGSRRWERFNASALTVPDPSGCAGGAATYSTPGSRYVEVASKTAGASGDLCTEDFAAIVRDLALANTQALDTYLLSGEPIAASLEVSLTVDGLQSDVPCESGSWVFARVADPSRPAVVFKRGLLPHDAAAVEVRYLLGSGSTDNFCGGEE